MGGTASVMLALVFPVACPSQAFASTLQLARTSVSASRVAQCDAIDRNGYSTQTEAVHLKMGPGGWRTGDTWPAPGAAPGVSARCYPCYYVMAQGVMSVELQL